MQKYEYKFLRMELKFGFMTGFVTETPDYHEAVRKHVEEGWRFVQIFAPGISDHFGRPPYYELIFERESV